MYQFNKWTLLRQSLYSEKFATFLKRFLVWMASLISLFSQSGWSHRFTWLLLLLVIIIIIITIAYETV